MNHEKFESIIEKTDRTGRKDRTERTDRIDKTEQIDKTDETDRTKPRRYSRHERYNRRARRKFRRKRREILLVIFLVALFVTCGIWGKAYFDTNVYQSKSEFEKYADREFESRQLFKMTSHKKVDYQYGTPISYAVDYDTYENEKITAFRDQQIDALKKTFAQVWQEEEAKREKKHGGESDYKPLAYAQLISSDVYESDRGITSLVIYESSNSEKEKEMEPVSSDIHTYQFSQKTGQTMVPIQMFAENYREKCSQYFTEYFEKNYKKEDFVEGWEAYLAPVETNFNKFAVMKSGVTFFFDEGTILDKSYGVVYEGISTTELGDYMRQDLIERYIDPAKPMVAITYDDGPGKESEDRILSCLEANHVVATFFYQGYRISGNEDKIKRAHDLGCEVGNHTWNHPVLTKQTPEEVASQLTNTNNAVYAACGVYPTVFRPSYGATNDAINAASGMPVIMWGLDTLDWKSRDGQAVFDLVAGSESLDGKIILLHSIHDSTADATELLIPWLVSQGYQLVTVTELITYKTGAPPAAGQVYR